MKAKSANEKTDQPRMYIFETLKKHCFVLFAALIALGGCNFSNKTKSTAGYGFLDNMSKFIIAHSNWFFFIISVLLIAQLIVYILKFNNDNSVINDKLDQLEKNQEIEIESAKKKWSNAAADLNNMNTSFQVDGEKSLSDVKDDKHKIYDCLKDVRTASIVNQSEYRYARGELYQYVIKVCKNIENRLRTLLEQYCNDQNKK